MYFNLDLLPTNILLALVDIKNCWLIVISERVLEKVCDETRLSHGSVAHKHKFQMLWSVWFVDFFGLISLYDSI